MSESSMTVSAGLLTLNERRKKHTVKKVYLLL